MAAALESSGLFVRSLARGLAVLGCFDGHPGRTTAQIVAATGLDRTTVRRLLATLQRLGFVDTSGPVWTLTPRVLVLGYEALSGMSFPELATPYLQAAAREADHSCSLAALDGPTAVFLARAAVRGVMTISLGPGVRVPAHASAMGRVLLSGLVRDDLEKLLHDGPLDVYTTRTVTDPTTLVEIVDQVRHDGFAVVDQELEDGVRSVAAPVRDRSGIVRAAVSIGTNSSVVGLDRLRGPVLDTVLRCATNIEVDLARLPVPLAGLGGDWGELKVRQDVGGSPPRSD